MEPRKRIPKHAHSGNNDGGLIAGSTVVSVASSGTGGGATTAAEVSILDTAGYFAATDVEAALAELAAGGGGGTLDGLSDVDTTGVADNDVLAYDSGTATWGPVAPSSGSGVTVQDEGTPLSTTATTLDFVGAGVTATGSGATKTITIPGASGSGNLTAPSALNVDLGRSQLLTVRAATNTEDDHFDAGSGSLDAKWLAYSGLDMTYSLSAVPGWLRATNSGVKLQAVPAGDWTIETEVLVGDIGAAAYFNSGLCLTSGTTYSSTTMETWYSGQFNSLTDYRWTVEKFVSGSYNSTQANWNARGFGYPVRAILAINKSGTTYNFLFSTVGTLAGSGGGPFQRFYQITSLGFTPTHFGLYSAGAGSMFNYFLRY